MQGHSERDETNPSTGSTMVRVLGVTAAVAVVVAVVVLHLTGVIGAGSH
ncbi:MAG: hypothetical protein ACJ757_11290 [Gaiellaceae bacterium]